MTDTVKAIILGLVEGLTEFIPVSSTGHLILAGHALDFNIPGSETFQIVIQLGAILAVVCLYWRRFLALLDFKTQDGFSGKNGLLKIGLACLPAFILGPLIHGTIKEYLFFPLPVAFALAIGGVLLLLGDKRAEQSSKTKTLESISFKQALLIGLWQCLSLWPGMSRSGATIVGGLYSGLSKRIAAEFSFLVAVPIMCAATLFDLYKGASYLNPELIELLLIGLLVSFVSGLIAIRIFLRILQNFSLKPFAIYRILLAGIILLLSLTT